MLPQSALCEAGSAPGRRVTSGRVHSTLRRNSPFPLALEYVPFSFPPESSGTPYGGVGYAQGPQVPLTTVRVDPGEPMGWNVWQGPVQLSITTALQLLHTVRVQ